MVRRRKKPAAAVLVAALVALIVVCLMSYGEKFTSTQSVTVVADRAGLVMDVGAKVKYRGATVGHVAAIESAGDSARIELDLYPDEMSRIDRAADVEIASTTVFGAKYVSFIPPEDASGTPLAADQVIDTRSVTVELNTVFENLTGVLKEVEPEKINTTLSTLSNALRGQGEELGAALESGDHFLAAINGALPAIRHDIAAAPQVIDTYADSAPDLMAALGQGTTTADTITDKRDALSAGLLSATSMSESGRALLDENGRQLTGLMDLLLPTTGLLAQYSPEYTCLIQGLEVTRERGEPAFGLKNPGMSLDVGFIPGTPLYQYPKHLPKVNASADPQCYGLPELPLGQHAPYLVTDTGVNPYPVQRTEPFVNEPNLLDYLLGGG